MRADAAFVAVYLTEPRGYDALSVFYPFSFSAFSCAFLFPILVKRRRIGWFRSVYQERGYGGEFL